MRSVANRLSRVWAMAVLVSCCVAFAQAAHAGEFRFFVEDLPDGTAAWFPSHVIIHQQTDLNGGLMFILENPTARTHVFFVDGLREQVVDAIDDVKSLRITIAPDETLRVVLSTEQFQGMRMEQDAEFRFFCPLHRGDSDPGGTIQFVHRGGTIHIAR